MQMKGDDIAARLVALAVVVVKLVGALPDTPAGKHVAGQLLRSGTSPGANYEEARGAESRRDFVHKVGIALKELLRSNALLSWDTSEIPADKTISRAWLRASIAAKIDQGGKNLDGDWYDWAPECEETDYVDNGSTNALSTSGACGSACQIANIGSGWPDFELDAAAENVDANGDSYLRLHVADDPYETSDGVGMATADLLPRGWSS
jgi:hypothetical protein